MISPSFVRRSSRHYLPDPRLLDPPPNTAPLRGIFDVHPPKEYTRLKPVRSKRLGRGRWRRAPGTYPRRGAHYAQASSVKVVRHGSRRQGRLRAPAKKSILRSGWFRQSGWAGVPGDRHPRKGVHYAQAGPVKAAGQGPGSGECRSAGQ